MPVISKHVSADDAPPKFFSHLPINILRKGIVISSCPECSGGLTCVAHGELRPMRFVRKKKRLPSRIYGRVSA